MADTAIVSIQQQQLTVPLPPAETTATATGSDSGELSKDGTASATLQWPSFSSLLMSQPTATLDLFPYPTFAESSAEQAGEESKDDEGDNWLDLALSSAPVRSVDKHTPFPSTAVTSALSALRSAHHREVEIQQLASAAWQAVKQQTRQHLVDSLSLPSQERHPPTVAAVATMSEQESQPAPHLLAAATAPVTASNSHPYSVEKRRKRRRVDDADNGAPSALPSRHPLSGTLGRHVPQLLHILHLKDSITQQHRALLQAAVTDKQRRSDEILSQQRIELAARQQRRQLAAGITQPAAADNMTDVQPTAAAVNPDTAPLSSSPATTATASPSPIIQPLPLPTVADITALLMPDPSTSSPASPPSMPHSQYSESQMLTLLPPVLAVHLLHCGFSSFPRSTLSVLSEATIDFIRRAGTALRQSQDDSKAARVKRRKQKVKAEVVKQEGGEEVGGWLTARLLRALGVGEVRTLQRFYERAIVRAGERVRVTEQRLTHIHTQLAQQQPDTVLHMTASAEGDIGSGGSGRFGASRWLCEPFSPLRSFVQPPAMPKTPPPLEEEKVDEPQPPQASSATGSGIEAMAVDGMAAVNVDGGQIGGGGGGVDGASVQQSSVSASSYAEAPEGIDEQAKTLPPLESVDGLLSAESTHMTTT